MKQNLTRVPRISEVLESLEQELADLRKARALLLRQSGLPEVVGLEGGDGFATHAEAPKQKAKTGRVQTLTRSKFLAALKGRSRARSRVTA